MAQEKKRRGRRAHLDDFHKTAGGYVYEGEMHPFQPGPYTRRQALARLWGLTAVMIAGAVAAGFLPAGGMGNCAYVILPYAAGLVSVVALTWLMARLTAGGESLRDYVYAATVRQFTPRGAAVAVCSAAAAVGELAFLLRNGAGERAAGSAAFLLCQVLACAAALLWLRTARRLRW